MKYIMLFFIPFLLAGCFEKTDTQLITEAGRQLQYAIDSNRAHAACEKIARGRENLTDTQLKAHPELGCQHVLRSSLKANFNDATVYRSSLLVICGSISGESFSGDNVTQEFIYSPGEKQLSLEPVSVKQISKFNGLKTLQQLQNDFAYQKKIYCK